MSKEYNSMLLARLMSTADDKKMPELLSEIEETNDPIFLHPLYQAYKDNKIGHIAHYFISAIGKLDSSDVLPIVFEIGEDSKAGSLELTYVLEIFDNRKVYDQRAIEIVLRFLDIFIAEKSDSDEYDLYSIVSYLKDANSLNIIESKLLEIFDTDIFASKAREYAFSKWLEVDPKKNLQVIIDDFDNIKNDEEKVCLIAKAINGWTGTKIEFLKNTIETKGGTRARHIIEKLRELESAQTQKKEIQKQQELRQEYGNANLIERITLTRGKINDVAILRQDIAFEIFSKSESLALQSKTVNDNASLTKACGDLRGIIQELNPRLQEHGLDKEQMQLLLPDTGVEDYNKSLNKLYFFLYSKKVTVNKEIFGLVRVNQLTGLIGAHAETEKHKLLKKLKDVKLDMAFTEEKWHIVHQKLLELYLDALEGLYTELKKKIETQAA